MRLLFVWLFAITLASSAQEKNAPKPKKSQPVAETITGCVDQSGETYILRNVTGAQKLATLRGKAFSDDNFARYVGHKVTVHGTREKEGDSSVIDVTKIDDAGPGCSGR